MTEQKNVFIIEDDSLMTRVFERLFRLSGFEVEAAADGGDALEYLKTATPKPDLILLDIMMPKVSGFDVLESLKNNPELKMIPIVVLTNVAGKKEAERAVEMGASLYLIKSEHDPGEIVEKAKRVMVG